MGTKLNYLPKNTFEDLGLGKANDESLEGSDDSSGKIQVQVAGKVPVPKRRKEGNVRASFNQQIKRIFVPAEDRKKTSKLLS